MNYSLEFNEIKKFSLQIVKEFLKDQYGEEEVKKFEKALEGVTFVVKENAGSEGTSADFDYDHRTIHCYKKEIDENKGKIGIISKTIHEITHAISNKNPVINGNIATEEAMANLFAEMCINNYLQKGKEIPYISNEENKKLQKTGHIEHNVYKKEGEFLRETLYLLRKKGKDLEAIRKYIFESREAYEQECIETIGEKYREIIEEVGKEKEINEKEKLALKKAENKMLKIYIEKGEEEAKEEEEIQKGNLYAIKGRKLFRKIYVNLQSKKGVKTEEIKENYEREAEEDPEILAKRYEEEKGKKIADDLQTLIDLQNGNETERKIFEGTSKIGVYQKVKKALDSIDGRMPIPGFSFFPNKKIFLEKTEMGKYGSVDLNLDNIMSCNDILDENFKILINYFINLVYKKAKDGDVKMKTMASDILYSRQRFEQIGADSERIEKLDQLVNGKKENVKIKGEEFEEVIKEGVTTKGLKNAAKGMHNEDHLNNITR